MASSRKIPFVVPFGILGGVGIATITTIVLLGAFFFLVGNANDRPVYGIPIIGKQDSEKDSKPAQKRWMTSAKEIVNTALKTVSIFATRVQWHSN